MDVNRYLLRIGITDEVNREISYEFLRKLQIAHLYSVPYENVDIIKGISLQTDLEKVYEKVVLRHRGGWCFELNALFSKLLSELGFVTKNYFARFWRGESGIPKYRHRVTAVFINGKTYIADVGIGAVSPRIPLLLEEGTVQEYFGESYRFEKDSEFGWVLYELRAGEWQKYFSFTEESYTDADFCPISYFCEKHESSKFNKNYIVALKSEKGRKCIDGNSFKEFCGSELAAIEENLSEARIAEILSEEFGIKF